MSDVADVHSSIVKLAAGCVSEWHATSYFLFEVISYILRLSARFWYLWVAVNLYYRSGKVFYLFLVKGAVFFWQKPVESATFTCIIWLRILSTAALHCSLRPPSFAVATSRSSGLLLCFLILKVIHQHCTLPIDTVLSTWMKATTFLVALTVLLLISQNMLQGAILTHSLRKSCLYYPNASAARGWMCYKTSTIVY